MPLNPEIIEECRRRFAAGETSESIVAYLRQIGLSKVESMKAFMILNRASAEEAKRLVHFSPTWAARYQQDEKFHDHLEKLVRDESDHSAL